MSLSELKVWNKKIYTNCKRSLFGAREGDSQTERKLARFIVQFDALFWLCILWERIDSKEAKENFKEGKMFYMFL